MIRGAAEALRIFIFGATGCQLVTDCLQSFAYLSNKGNTYGDALS